MKTFLTNFRRHCHLRGGKYQYIFGHYNQEDTFLLSQMIQNLDFRCSPLRSNGIFKGFSIEYDGYEEELVFLDSFYIEIPDTPSLECLAIALWISYICDVLEKDFIELTLSDDEVDSYFIHIITTISNGEGRDQFCTMYQLMHEFPSLAMLEKWLNNENITQSEIPLIL